MRKYRKVFAMYVSVGDVVEIVLDHMRDYKPQYVLVTAIDVRRGLINRGTLQPSPLITGIDQDTREEIAFDNSYVTAIIERSKITGCQFINVFRDAVLGWSIMAQGSTWVGYLNNLTILALGALPFELDRQLCEERVALLFEKQMPGFLGMDMDEDGLITVNAKHFKRWVRANWHRLILTAHEQREHGTRMNREYEEDYWSSIDEEVWEELNEREPQDCLGEQEV